MNTNAKTPTWEEVEKHLDAETRWLRRVLSFYHTPKRELKNIPLQYGHCDNCLLRNVAMMISAGTVEAKEIKKDEDLLSFWPVVEDANSEQSNIYHGKEWHSRTMEAIKQHFQNEGFEVTLEPRLHWGRADLGVHKEGEKDLIVEVGTLSALKLFINLKFMKDFIYLVVPNDERIVEFRKD